ncbi:MAG: hypothetical protein M5U25_16035 [Planctomycetota bacterium]|nr:hypothetical protein [Planctomycetota bacterium]
MSHALQLLRSWSGVWSGEIEHESGALLNGRVSVPPILEGHAMVMHAEITDRDTGRLMRGLRMVFAQGPDGVVQTLTFSTQLGVFGLEQTQDDEDVIAMMGITETGVQINVTFREEAPVTILLTVFWRPQGTSLPGVATPGLFGRVHRRAPWNPAAAGKP